MVFGVHKLNYMPDDTYGAVRKIRPNEVILLRIPTSGFTNVV